MCNHPGQGFGAGPWGLVLELRWGCTESGDVPPLESGLVGSGTVGGPVSLVTVTQPCGAGRLLSPGTQAGWLAAPTHLNEPPRPSLKETRAQLRNYSL